MSLRRRLALTMIALIVAGCVALGTISIFIVDRTLRVEIDDRLATLASTEAQVVDDDAGRAVVDADDVAQMNAMRHPDEHVAIVDRHGRLIFGESPPGSEAPQMRLTKLRILHPKNGKLDDLGTIDVWESADLLESFRRTSILTFCTVTFVLAVIAGLLSRRFADAILNPVNRVARLAERIESHDLSARLGSHGSDELGRLCASFDRMLERLEESFDKERRFVADASHELRAPLAVVRAETDLALRRERTPADYRSALESIDRETLRLESLVDQLLGSMRETALLGDEVVNLSQTLSGLVERMRSASYAIHLAQTGGEALVRGHAQSIERAFTAILHNAVTHGGGHIEILVSAAGELVRVDIVDGGTGFCDEALAHATERFWRGDTARSRGGTGLGLAIARVLVEVNGGELRLANTQHAGAAVSLLFPRAVASG